MGHDVQKIYCDESGFTGNNLLHPLQPLFVYASIAMNEQEADQIVCRIKKDYHVQGNELKGSRLIRYNKGKMAISEILESLEDKVKVSMFDKKYSLCCDFFEIIFEPLISDINSLFYEIGFHKFIGNILYMEFGANRKGAEEILEEFENLARNRNIDELFHLFGSIRLPYIDPILDNMKKFTFYNKEKILEEIKSLHNIGVGKWILDMTDKALFPLLADWGQVFAQIQVFCDESKPLNSSKEFYAVMIGRLDKKYSYPIQGQSQPITFNLYEEINLVSSRDYPGIQLADVIAAAFAYAYTNSDRYAQKWREYAPHMVEHRFIMPDIDLVDLNHIDVQRNALVLEELVDRSVHGESLIDEMPEYIRETTKSLLLHPLRIP